MEIRFYNINKDGRYMNKNADLVNPTIKNVTLKNNPTNTNDFFLDLSGASNNYQGFNYAYIPHFNKYYFVGEPISLNNSITRLPLTCDYLFTHREKLLNIDVLVERSESHGNGWLNDSDYPISAKNKVISKNFPNALEDDTIILITVG